MIEKANHIGSSMIVWRKKIKKVIENTYLANSKNKKQFEHVIVGENFVYRLEL